METVLRDLRYGLRTLIKNPGFTAVAVLTLALGIGANTAIFTVLNAVVLRPFPFAEPERLAIVWERQLQRGLPQMFASPPNYADWCEQQTVFDEMAAFDSRGLFLKQGDNAVRVIGTRATASLFDVLKVAPMLGRVFTADEDRPGADKVVVLSYTLWQSRFGGDPGVIGRQILLDEQPHTVIGVMPQLFKFPPPIDLEGRTPDPRIDLWVPFALDMKGGQRGAHFMKVIARLKTGVSLERADAEMNAVARHLAAAYPDQNAGWDVTLVPFTRQALGDIGTALWVLLGAVGFVLLIACLNVSNLLLARGMVRRKEFAIRAALGAGRRQLIRQLLVESLVLAALGGAVGLLLASWTVRLLVALAPQNVPRLDESGIDWVVIGFAFTVSLVAGLLFGLVPALRISSPDLNQWLKEGGRAGSDGAGQFNLRGALVMAEIALSLVLLVGAGLLFQSFLRLRNLDTGFQPDNVLTLRLDLPQSQFPERAQRAAAYQELEQRLNALPQVESAGFVYDVPLLNDRQGTEFTVEGEPPPEPGKERQVNFSFVTPGYFRSLHIPLLRGRQLTEQDAAGAPDVVVINEALARRYFPDEDPLGKRLFVGFSTQTPRRVVGIVGDERHSKLKDAPNPGIYTPYYQVPWSRSMSLVIRSRVAATSLLPAVREQIGAVVPSVPIYDVKTMTEVVSDSISQPRFSTLVLGVFSGMALLLAALGIYGVMSYMVTQHTREIGIRMALGAQASDVLKLVVGQGAVLAGAGVLIGLAASLALTRLLRALLFGVSATDPLTFALVPVLLLGVALLACYVPARRATKVDPMVALRYE